MTDIYKQFLKSKYGDDIEAHMLKVLKRGDGSTVSMMREIREATEGGDIGTDSLTITITRKRPEDDGSH